MLLSPESWKSGKTWESRVRRGKRYHIFVSCVIKGMKKRSEFQLPCLILGVGRFSLTQPRVVENRYMGGELDKGYFKCGLSKVRPSSVPVKLLQARFPNHHKQDFSLLTPTSNYRYMKFSLISACGFHP